MKIMDPEDFNKEETLIITDNCFVAGVMKTTGESVVVKGNDKIQLLGSRKGCYPEDFKGKIVKKSAEKTNAPDA